mgnify:FL=1
MTRQKTRVEKALPLIDSSRAFTGKSIEPEVELKYDVSFEADAEFLQLFNVEFATPAAGKIAQLGIAWHSFPSEARFSFASG